MKKKSLIGFASVALLLTGCNEIFAKPENLDETYLVVDSTNKLVNNTLEKVYKTYSQTSSFKQYVLDELLLNIAEVEFGAYDTLEDTSAFKKSVDERAKHKFYSEISSGGYTYHSVFDEYQFVTQKVYQSANSYIVDTQGEPIEIGALVPSMFYKEGIFSAQVDKTNFDEAEFKLVHIDYYTDYIRETFVDSIYRDKLVEKYVQTEQKSTLGRNYAREVEYIAIPNNDKHPTAANALVNAYVDNYILGSGDADLNILANAWRGVDLDKPTHADAKALLTSANLTTANTLYGDVLADYALIQNNPLLTDVEIENRFTGNGKYTKEVGKEIEENEIRKQKFVTTDWGIKNGGLGGLPEEIRSRLFNIGVANGVDLVKDDEGILANAGKWIAEDESGRLPNTFVRNINGNYYLVPKTYEKNDNRNFVFFENNTYYIINVKEAVNTTKLASKDTDAASYENYKSAEEIAVIVDEVTYHLSQLEATKTTALNYYMGKLDIVFHDENVRDFFYETFPDIFDEDEK